MMSALLICFKSPVDYASAMIFQEKLVAARIAGDIPDVVLFLEHTSVITMGTRARESNLLLSPRELARRKIKLVKTSRGGDVTWHGPGQMVMYPVIKLGEREADARGYLRNLEEIAIRTARDFDVSAYRRDGKTGAWTDKGKLAAIGVRFKRWVAFHGLSFNVNPDMSGFETIIPCGLVGERATSLLEIMGEKSPPPECVRERMIANFSDVCGRDFKRIQPGDSADDTLFRCLSGCFMRNQKGKR